MEQSGIQTMYSQSFGTSSRHICRVWRGSRIPCQLLSVSRTLITNSDGRA